jgi:hypothetical protein
MSVRYRFLCHAAQGELLFPGVRDAFDRACLDLERESAAPLEIWDGESLVFTLGTLCELLYDWQSWRSGQAKHPLE